MTTVEVPFSELVNQPVRTVAKLTSSAANSMRLVRRNDIDLVLTTATRHDQEAAVVTAATRLFTALLREGEHEQSLLERVLAEAFPWVWFLPGEDRTEFIAELVATMRGAADLDNLAPVSILITEWRHTAEVHADPELTAVLRQDADDLGPAPTPESR